jgi:hypothetical protein
VVVAVVAVVAVEQREHWKKMNLIYASILQTQAEPRQAELKSQVDNHSYPNQVAGDDLKWVGWVYLC